MSNPDADFGSEIQRRVKMHLDGGDPVLVVDDDLQIRLNIEFYHEAFDVTLKEKHLEPELVTDVDGSFFVIGTPESECDVEIVPEVADDDA